MILGASGIGMAAYEIFRSHNLIIFGFLDDREEMQGKEIDEVMVLGKTDDDGFLKYIGHKCEAFVASDDNMERRSLVKMLRERRKVMPINAIHKNASLPKSVSISYGNFIDDGAVLGAGSTVGSHNLIHAGVILGYDIRLDNFIQIGMGAIINAGVTIGDETFIGPGSTIVSGLSIGRNARIGAGSVVIEPVEDNTTVFGNPAKPVQV